MREYQRNDKVSCDGADVVLFRNYSESKEVLKDGSIITTLVGQEPFRVGDGRILKKEIIQYKGRPILVARAKTKDGINFTFIPGFLVEDEWRQQEGIKISLMSPIDNHQQQEKIKKFLRLSSEEIVYFWER